MGHRSVLVPGAVMQVSKVVLERRLAVAVAVGGAQRERLFGQGERLGQLAGVTPDERQVVERGGLCCIVAQLLRQGDAALE
jgi:hypothetical protein